MPTLETSMLKLLGRSLAVAALAWSFSNGLQAQTSAVTMGSTSTSTDATTAAPAAPGINTLLFNAARQAAPDSASKADTTVADTAPARSVQRVAGPNQFQRFVAESTGRVLPVYGSELFSNPQNFATNTAVPAPDNYILGPGDQLHLQVSGPQDFSTTLVLDRDGQVNLPKLGAVTLAGVAAQDLEKTLSAQLGKIFTNFKLNASLGRLRGIQVYVVGQAQQPGTYQLSSVSTLVNALFASGGPGGNGSMRAIELKRGGKTITTLDLYDFISKGDKSRDLPLLSGDVIVIPSVGPRVAITGAFDQAAIYELKPGATSVADILNLGGGVPALATPQKALLERITRASNPPRQVQELMLDANGLRLPLQDGDVLTLLGISPAFANAVTLQGTVAAPLRYRWFEGMKILDLIPERDALITGDYYKRKNLLVQNDVTAKAAGDNVSKQIRSMVDQINWDYAVIERLDRTKLSSQLIPFNLGKAVLQKDPEHNLPLLAGDVVTILSQSDLRVPLERQSQLVRLEGEVRVPGVYQTLPGETLPQLIQRVGGLSNNAYVFGTEFTRESVKTRQQQNLDNLIRRLEAQAQAQQGSAVANRSSTGSTDQTVAIVQLQQAQLKSQIERLKTFKSNGRIALELDPFGQSLAALPDLPLEDGDRILVPSAPGFVAAFGAVNNENMFIYKPGKTVADVIKSAGLTEDAEPAQAFVLRADGSIIARNDRSGWFDNSFESVLLMPGDTLVVPAQIDRETRYSAFIRGAKDWTQILANLGLGIAAINSL